MTPSRPAALPDPSNDLMDCPPVERVVVIASQMRSGSSLLARSLRNTGLVGIPDEYLLPKHIMAFRERLGVPNPSLIGRLGRTRRRVTGALNWEWTEHFTRSSLSAYLRRLAELRTTPNGVFSMKVQSRQLPVLSNAGLDLGLWGPRPEFIALDRLDRVAQAVSQERTSQDRVYSSDEERDPSITLHYDEQRLRGELALFEAGARAWNTYFATHGLDPFRITYEELDSDYAGTMRRVFDHLGFTELEVGEPPIARVRDEVNDEWAERLRAALARD